MTDIDDDTCVALGVTRIEVERWVSAGWVLPDGTAVDTARLRLLVELRTDLGLDDEAIPVVLSLIDQVHGLRHQLHRLAHAIEQQPVDVRSNILATLNADDRE